MTPNTVSRIEGRANAKTDTLARIIAALDSGGGVFILANGGGPDVRLRG